MKGKLDRDPTVVEDCSICLIYVRMKHSTTESLTEVLLESKLQTRIWGTTLSGPNLLQRSELKSPKLFSTML